MLNGALFKADTFSLIALSARFLNFVSFFNLAAKHSKRQTVSKTSNLDSYT